MEHTVSGKYNPYRSLSGINITNYSVDELKELVRSLLQGKIHGISFSPYVEGQGPGTTMTEEQIRERMQIIAPYVNWIRSFSCTEGNQLIPKVAKEMGLKTLVGVWLDDDLENNELELSNALELAKQGYVDLLAVGNEVLLRGDLTQDQLIDYLKRAKAGANPIPVGYVDAYFEFVDYPEITAQCDVIFANCYPFWEGYPAEHALVYMKDMYHRAIKAGNGKPVIISETGWPNLGTAVGQAIPSYENAVKYLVNSYQWAEEEGVDIFYFSSFDEAWKVDAEGDVGAYWGIWDKNGKLKYG